MSITRILASRTGRYFALALLVAGCGSSGGTGDADSGVGPDGDGGSDAGCEGAPLTSDGVLDLDVQSVRVHGTVTVNGGPIPDETRPRGELELRDVHSLQSLRVPLDATGGVTYDISLSPGTYSVSFIANRELCGPGRDPRTPCNDGPLLDGIDLTSDGVLDVDIPAVHVSGHILLNGAAVPSESGDRGTIAMAMRGGGAETWPLGTSGRDTYQLTLLPGTYDVIFDGNPELCGAVDAPAIPCSGGTLLAGVSLSADGVLDLDIPAVRVSGAVTLDSAPMPAADGDRGRLRFGADVSTRSFGSSGPVSYEVSLWPATYDVSFEGTPGLCQGMSPPPVPCNKRVVRASVQLTTDGALDVDLHGVQVSGTVTLEGASLPSGPASRGHLSFGDLASRDFGTSGAGTYGVTLLAGTYTVRYVANPELCGHTTAVPCNGGTIEDALPITTDGVYDVDLEPVRLSGAVTLRGNSLPTEQGDRGSLVFAPTAGQKVVQPLESSGAHQYALNLWPGTYDITFAANPSLCDGEDTPQMPCTGGVLHQNLLVKNDGVLDLDIPAVRVSGSVTLDNAPMPDDAADRGRISFALDDGQAANTASFATSGAVSYAISLWPGTYEVSFAANSELCGHAAAPAVPCIGAVLQPSSGLLADGVLNLDIPAVRVSGAVTLNHALIADEDGDRGALAFRRVHGAKARTGSFGLAGPTTYDVLLVPGNYVITYEANDDLCDDQTVPALPCNDQYLLGCGEAE